MTEFDLRFEKNLKSNNITPKNKTCFHCHTKDGEIYDALKDRDKALKVLKEDLPLAIEFISSLFLFIVLLILYGTNQKPNLIDYIVVFGIMGLAFLTHIWGAYTAIKKMNIKEPDCYYTTKLVSRVSSDGSIVTSTENVLTCGDSEGASASTMFFTYFFWCILRPLIIYSKSNSHLKKICPKEIIKIYDKTKKEVKEIVISERIVKKQERKISEHNKKIQETEQKYKMMDKKRLERELSKIEKPVLPLFQKKYLIADTLYVNGSKADLMFYRNRSGQITGNVIINGYFVNSNEQNWSDAWLAIYGKSSRKDKESYPEKLKHIINSHKMYL